MRKSLFAYLLLFIWEIFCLASFFYGVGLRSGVHLFAFENHRIALHQLAAIDFSQFFCNLLGAFLGAALFALSAIGFGLALMRIQVNGADFLSEKEPFVVTAFSLGQGVLSLLLLISLVVFRQLGKRFTVTLLGVGLAFFLVQIRLLLSRGKYLAKTNLLFPRQPANQVLVFLLLVAFGVTFLYSSSRLSYDAATQYFAQAKIIAQSEQLILLSFKDTFAGSALHLVSLFAAVIQLFGEQAARAYTWMNGLAVLVFGLMLGSRIGLSGRAHLLFLALLLTSTAFVDLLGDGKIDISNTLLALASMFWFIRSIQEKNTHAYFITGFLTGYSIVSRPYNAILLGLSFLFIFSIKILTEKSEHILSNKLLFITLMKRALPPLLLWGVFLALVNTKIYNDPLAPLTIIGLNSESWPFYPTRLEKITLLLSYPFSVSFGGFFDTLGFISPLFLAFLPSIFIKQIRMAKPFSKELIFILLSSVLTLYLWIGVFGAIHILELRYVLFLWIILFLFVAQLMDRVMLVSYFSNIKVQVILIIILLFIIFRTMIIAFSTFSPIDEDGVPHCSNLPMCTFFESINRYASPYDRVLVLGGYRYYLRPDLFIRSSVGSEYLQLENAAQMGPEKFWQEVERQGYRFVIYDSFYLKYILRLEHLPDLSAPPVWIKVYEISNLTFKDYNGREVTESTYCIDTGSSDLWAHTKCDWIQSAP